MVFTVREVLWDSLPHRLVAKLSPHRRACEQNPQQKMEDFPAGK
jgi:hypothetical protein